MNWTDSRLKTDAREVLKASYWRCVLAGIAAIVAMGAIRVITPGNLKSAIEGNLRMITSYDLHKWANMYSQIPQYRAPDITPATTFGMMLKLFSPRMLWSLMWYFIKGTIISMIQLLQCRACAVPARSRDVSLGPALLCARSDQEL